MQYIRQMKSYGMTLLSTVGYYYIKEGASEANKTV